MIELDMKRFIEHLRAIAVATVAATIVFVAGCSFSEISGARQAVNTVLTEAMSEPSNDPCLFLKYTAENAGDHRLRERQTREIVGFASDVAMSDALTIFNAELKCFPGVYDPLSEDEVIASISAGPDYGAEGLLTTRRDELLRIIKNRRMPKGSLFVSEGDLTYSSFVLPGEVAVKGHRIYLFLGLDKTPRESNLLNPDQIFMIRKKFIKATLEKPKS